jgi:hypothetical protein
MMVTSLRNTCRAESYEPHVGIYFFTISVVYPPTAEDDSSMFFSGPIEAERGTSVLSRRAGSSGISWRTLSLVKNTLHRHRVGFESQRASSFMKWVKALQMLGEAA